MKFIVVILLLAIIASLFSGLFFLLRDKGNSNRVVNALTVRVALSIGIFLLLMISYYFGIYPAR